MNTRFVQPAPIRYIQVVSPDEAKKRQVEPIWQRMIGLTEAFAIPDKQLGRTKHGIPVPLIFSDTGTEDRHPDIDGNLAPWAKAKYASAPWAVRRKITGGRDCSNTRPKDNKYRRPCYGNVYNRKNWQCCKATSGDHGLMTSGMAAAKNNEIGIRGIDADTWMLKVFADRNGFLLCVDEWLVASAQAVKEIGREIYRPHGIYGGVWVLALGGHYKMSLAVEKAFDALVDDGWIILASAGNDAKSIMYPAAFDSVISVGALDEQGQPAGWSCRGELLDQAGPGTRILTLARNGKYVFVDGTSFSAPAVAIVAAILKARYPEIGMNTYEARKLLDEKATEITDEPGWQLVKAEQIAALHKISTRSNEWDLSLRVA